MKKRTTFIITLIAIITALTTACGTAKENSLPSTSFEDKPQATTSISTTETTTAKPAETTAQTTQQTTAQTTTTTTTAETTRAKPIETTATAPAETTVQTTAVTVHQAEPVHSWTESEYKATMYVNESCNSRKDAVIGATAVKSYSVNTKVSVTAKTDTGYCKLADGTYIHSDYLSTDKVKETTTTTTAKPKPAETTAKEETTTQKAEEEENWKFTKADCEYILKECEKYAKDNGYKYEKADLWWKYDSNHMQVPCKVGEVYQNSSWNMTYVNTSARPLFRWKGYTRKQQMIGLLCENIEMNNSDGYTTCIDFTTIGKYIEWAENKGWDMKYEKQLYNNDYYVFFPCFG